MTEETRKETMSEEGVPCRRCGGEGQPWCRPSLDNALEAAYHAKP